MRCPACDTEILHPGARYCPNCAAALTSSEAEVTTELRHDHEPRDTSTIDASLVHDFVGTARRAFVGGGWLDLIGAAAFGLLCLVAAASVLVAAAKLHHEGLGAGADTVATISALFIAALGLLRSPVNVGDLTISALPLGALALALWGLAWATARAIRRNRPDGSREALLYGAKVAAPFAIICWAAALVFRIREEPTPVGAEALPALLLGAIWGLVAGIAAGFMASSSARGMAATAREWLRARHNSVYEGATAGGVMLLASFGLAAAAVLLWIIVALLTGRPAGEFGGREAIAGAIYLIAFAPNVITSAIALGLGAPIEVGAQVSAGGQMVGELRTISLWDWAGGATPWYVALLMLVPLLACSLGGFAARRHTRAERKVLEVLVVAAATYGIVLFELAALSEARLGAGLVTQTGFARLAPDPTLVLLLASLWALGAGFLGWKIAESQS